MSIPNDAMKASSRGRRGGRTRSPRRARVCVATAVMGLTFCAPLAAQVQFPVSFEASAAGLTASERAAIVSHVQAAGRLWAAELDLDAARSIEVDVGIDDTRPRAGGASVTSVFVGVVGGRDLFDQGAAAELRTGIDPNGAAADARITFNTQYLRSELWFDPDPAARVAPVPSDRTDAMSVVLHELGHVLAYNGFNRLSDGVPQPTFWSTFDQWIVPAPPFPIRFAGPAVVGVTQAPPDLTLNNIFHWGNPVAGVATVPALPRSLRFDAGRPRPEPPIDEPRSVDAEAWLADSAQGSTFIDELMNGVVFFRGRRYALSALDRAALRDVGLPTVLFASGFE